MVTLISRIALIWLTVLGAEKLVAPMTGFRNPYSFIAAVLLVLGGFQIAVFGFLSWLMLQVRREVPHKNGLGLKETYEPPVGHPDEEYHRN